MTNFDHKTSMDISPVTLNGKTVRLEPLSMDHAPDLLIAGREESIWQFMPIAPITSLDALSAWIREAHSAQRAETDLPFAIVLQESSKAIGSTRYLDIQIPNSALEIGWTWISPEYQRTAVNTECKYLLLQHAFESLGAKRVQLKTDGRNLKSQAAIERIGAKREGVLRQNRKLWNGFVRDTVVFSILDDEWPSVKENLLGRMQKVAS